MKAVIIYRLAGRRQMDSLPAGQRFDVCFLVQYRYLPYVVTFRLIYYSMTVPC